MWKPEMFEDILDLQALFLNMGTTDEVCECLKLHERTHLEMDGVLMKSRNILVGFRRQSCLIN